MRESRGDSADSIRYTSSMTEKPPHPNIVFNRKFMQLCDEIAMSGRGEAAQAFRDSWKGFNGLTDGWALLHEQLDTALETYGATLEKRHLERMTEMRDIISKSYG